MGMTQPRRKAKPAEKSAVSPAGMFWRPSDADRQLIAALEAHLGVSGADVLRIGVRALARKEGIGGNGQ